MKWRRKMFAAVSSLAVLSAALLAGCGQAPEQETAGTSLSEGGTLLLSVNPEIQIDYNKEGHVTALSGKNEDGKSIVAGYPDYVGKECDDVLEDLIVAINDAGYFIEDIDGHEKNIVLQLEPGSVLPSDDFLEEISASTQAAVKGLSLSSGIVTIDDDDYDPAYAKDGQPSPYITLKKAQEIALTQAGVKSSDAVFDDKEFDHDDGTPIFELEFKANGIEYEYDIDAVTGKVLKAEHHAATSSSVTSGQTNGNSDDRDDADDNRDDVDDDRDDKDDDRDDKDDDWDDKDDDWDDKDDDWDDVNDDWDDKDDDWDDVNDDWDDKDDDWDDKDDDWDDKDDDRDDVDDDWDDKDDDRDDVDDDWDDKDDDRDDVDDDWDDKDDDDDDDDDDD